MSKPELESVIDGYVLRWADHELTAHVSQVRTHTDGRITAEVKVTTNRKGFSPGLIPLTDLNLKATQSRRRWAGELVMQYPDWPWDTILDQLCHLCIEQVRAGEPLKELWTDAVDVLPPEWLIEPVLYQGMPTIIFGEKAVSKSTLALLLYTVLTLPWPDNPLGLRVQPRVVPCLLLDWEVDERRAQYTAKRLQDGLELPAFPVNYRRCALPLADDVAQIQQHVVKLKAEVVIIDSLGPAVGGDLFKAADALRFSQALRQLRCAALILGQTAKPQDDNPNRRSSTYGSAMFEYYARCVWELRKVQQEDEDTVDLALFHKYNNLGRRSPPLGYHLNYNGSGIHIKRQDARSIPEFVARMTANVRIAQALRDFNRWTSPKELEERLPDMARGTLGSGLKRLLEAGKIILKDGRYGLTPT